MILQSDKNDMETTKAVMEGILEEKEREFEERRQTREYELERLRLSNATETVSVSSADLEGQGVNRRVNLKDLVPKFDAKNADINLFFEIFERQAKKEKVAEDRWVSQLISLLPIEIAEIVAKEPLEKSDDYPHIKNLLLARFQLTPIALRDRFESHQRRPGAMWADLVFELRSYLDNWLAGIKVDSWDGFKEAKSLAEKLDHFEAIRRVHKKTGPTKTWERKTFDKQSLESKNKSAHFSGKGEYVWLKSPLDEICHCLPLAKIKIKTKKGEFYTKAAIKQDSSDNDLYLLGNRTAELLESNEQGVQLVNAVVTRSKQRFSPEKEKEANEEELELTDSPLRPREGKTIALSFLLLKEKGKRVWRKDVEEFVKTCDSCQRVGKPRDKVKAPLKLVPIISEVFSKINIDAVGPLPVSTKQNRYLITSICVASKYPEAIPVESITSPNVIDALLSIFSRIGFPCEIQSDLGTSFTSELTTTFFNKFGIKVTRSSVSHPQCNAVERVHRTIKRVVKALCVESGEDWEGVLPLALFSLRTVAHESTGFSPTELVMGKN
ncbi:retrovirus-related Pol polyprotein from transposon 412 [Trichonephila clavipes]|nr:retrovirus-related Pol polyprotein from transposon 412 [Trichonephila clavipes]